MPKGVRWTEGGLQADLFLTVIVFLGVNPFLVVLSQEQISSYLSYLREQARCAGRFPVRWNKKSAQPDTASTAAYRTKPINLHIPKRITAACPEGWGVGRGSGLRNSECLPAPRISPLSQSTTFSKKSLTYSVAPQSRCQADYK